MSPMPLLCDSHCQIVRFRIKNASPGSSVPHHLAKLLLNVRNTPIAPDGSTRDPSSIDMPKTAISTAISAAATSHITTPPTVATTANVVNVEHVLSGRLAMAGYGLMPTLDQTDHGRSTTKNEPRDVAASKVADKTTTAATICVSSCESFVWAEFLIHNILGLSCESIPVGCLAPCDRLLAVRACVGVCGWPWYKID